MYAQRIIPGLNFTITFSTCRANAFSGRAILRRFKAGKNTRPRWLPLLKIRLESLIRARDRLIDEIACRFSERPLSSFATTRSLRFGSTGPATQAWRNSRRDDFIRYRLFERTGQAEGPSQPVASTTSLGSPLLSRETLAPSIVSCLRLLSEDLYRLKSGFMVLLSTPKRRVIMYYVGIDWADQKHDFAVLDSEGQLVVKPRRTRT